MMVQANTKRWWQVGLFGLVAVVTAVAVPAAAAPPQTLAVEGALLSNQGGPVSDGTYNVTFSLYDSKGAQASVWSEGPVKLNVSGGAFQYALGSNKALGAALFTAGKAAWIGLKVGNDPEMLRMAVHAMPYALRAETAAAAHVAMDLKCSGCVSVSELKIDGDLDLGGNALKAKKVTAATITAQTLTANVLLGDGSKLTGIKVPAGSCKAGEVVTGINVDGSLKCAKAATGSADKLPPDGLDEVSNKLLWNQFTDVFAGKGAPKAILDNNPIGIFDEVTVPDLGTAQKLIVNVDIINSDITGIKVIIYDPANGTHVLHDKGGKGNKLVTGYPAPTKEVTGTLASWVGKNPKGKWRIKVLDLKAGAGGNDGKLNSWNVTVQTMSSKKVQVKGDLWVDGKIYTAGKPPVQLFTASSDGLEADKYIDVDTKKNSALLAAQAWVADAAGSWQRSIYDRNATYCPACGTGSQGEYIVTGSTSHPGGTWHYTRFEVKKGATLYFAADSKPFVALVAGPIIIDGTIRASGSGGGAGKCGGHGQLGAGKTGGYNGGYSQGGAHGAGQGAGKAGCQNGSSGSGGGYGTPGDAGSGSCKASPGSTYNAGAKQMLGGSGGGSGRYNYVNKCTFYPGGGGAGGGVVALVGQTVTINGTISTNGGHGGGCQYAGCGGGGSGGLVWLRGRTVTVKGTVEAKGGAGGQGQGATGGNGGYGLVRIDAFNSSGSTTPKYFKGSTIGLSAPENMLISQPKAGVVRLTNKSGVKQKVRLIVVQ